MKSYHEYTYNDRNFPVQKRSIAGDLSYAYDPNGQLSSASSVAVSESYSYDPLGNRITDQNGLYVYDEKSQLLKEDYQYLYNYDNNGNLISKIPKDSNKNAWAYHYSSKNQLMKVQQMDRPLGQVIRQVDYRYDVLGRRKQKSVWTKDAESDPKKTYVRKYIYDGDNIFAEFDGNNVLIARYTHSPLGPDDILESEITNAGVTAGLAQNDGKYFYLKDALGSVTDISNENGQIVQRYDYESFGKIRSITSVGGGDITSSPIVNTSFTYTGREWDEEAGLYYYRARYYDANVGRFIQQDPHPGKLNRPDTVVNRYAYVSNMPIIATDPSGKFVWIPFILALGKAVLMSAAIGALVGGVIGGLIAKNHGGNFNEGFLIGAAAGAKSGALFGLSAFLLGAALPAVFPSISANAVQLTSGVIMGAVGAKMGSKYGWEGALIGGVAGFVGGMLGSAAGYNAYHAGSSSAVQITVSPPPKIPESPVEPVLPTMDDLDPQPALPVGPMP